GPGRRHLRRELCPLPGEAGPDLLGDRPSRGRLLHFRSERLLVRPGERRLHGRAPGELPVGRPLDPPSRLPSEQPSGGRVLAPAPHQSNQPQLPERRLQGPLRPPSTAPRVRRRRLSLRSGPFEPPPVVCRVRPGAHEPLARSPVPLAADRRRRRPAAPGKRLGRRRLGPCRYRDRRRPAHPEAPVPARILRRPFAERAVLQGPDSVLRPRHTLPLLTPSRVGSRAMAVQDLRSFVDAYGRAHPGEVIRVTEPVSIEEDVMALVLEYERRRRFPILIYEKVAGYDIPIVCNAVASRRALAVALRRA